MESYVEQEQISFETIKSQSQLEPSYDYIIIGGGTSGCIIASKLVEAGYSVVIIESGDHYNDVYNYIPTMALFQIGGFKDWNYFTTNQQNLLNGRHIAHSRGKCLGGSSLLNFMLWVHPHPNDFNSIENSGCNGWSYKDVSKFFKSIENVQFDDCSILRGKNGKTCISKLNTLSLPNEIFLEQFKKNGFNYIQDYNDSQMYGISKAQFNTKLGLRHSVVSAYISPALERGLRIVLNADVEKITFNTQQNATGVDYYDKTKKKLCHLSCNKEIILSAGAFGSPQVLMLSGVGPKEQLIKHNIQIICDSQGVGQNLQDHFFIPLFFKCKNETNNYNINNVNNIYKLFTEQETIINRIGVEMIAFSKFNKNSISPDMQYTFFMASPCCEMFQMLNYSEDILNNFKNNVGNGYGFYVMVTKCKPKSKGHVALNEVNPNAQLVIDPCYLTNEEDLEYLKQGCKFILNLSQCDEFINNGIEFVGHKILGENIEFENEQKYDQFVTKYIKTLGVSNYHPTSTCAMGTVVDDQLKVKGVNNLRICDLSVLPNIVTGNTQCTAYIIAEKLASMILK